MDIGMMIELLNYYDHQISFLLVEVDEKVAQKDEV